MGNTVSGHKRKQPREKVAMMFYDTDWTSNESTLSAFRESDLYNNVPYEECITAVERDGVHFDFVWGNGLGRCIFRPVAMGMLSHIGAFILVINQSMVIGGYREYFGQYLQSQLSHPALGKQVKVLFMMTASKEEPSPSQEEVAKAIGEMVDGWVKNYDVVSCTDSKTATLKTAMDMAVGWIGQQKALKESQQQQNEQQKKVTVFHKLKSMVKLYQRDKAFMHKDSPLPAL